MSRHLTQLRRRAAAGAYRPLSPSEAVDCTDPADDVRRRILVAINAHLNRGGDDWRHQVQRARDRLADSPNDADATREVQIGTATEWIVDRLLACEDARLLRALLNLFSLDRWRAVALFELGHDEAAASFWEAGPFGGEFGAGWARRRYDGAVTAGVGGVLDARELLGVTS